MADKVDVPLPVLGTCFICGKGVDAGKNICYTYYSVPKCYISGNYISERVVIDEYGLSKKDMINIPTVQTGYAFSGKCYFIKTVKAIQQNKIADMDKLSLAEKRKFKAHLAIKKGVCMNCSVNIDPDDNVCYSCYYGNRLTYSEISKKYGLSEDDLPQYLIRSGHGFYQKLYLEVMIEKIYNDKMNRLDELSSKEKKKLNDTKKKNERKAQIEKLYKDLNIGDHIESQIDTVPVKDYLMLKRSSFEEIEEHVKNELSEIKEKITNQQNIIDYEEKLMKDQVFELGLTRAIRDVFKITGTVDKMSELIEEHLNEYRKIIGENYDTRSVREAELKDCTFKEHFIAQLYIRGGLKLLTILTNGKIISPDQITDYVGTLKTPIYYLNEQYDSTANIREVNKRKYLVNELKISNRNEMYRLGTNI